MTGLLQGISCYQADMCEAVGEQPYGALVVQFKKNLFSYEQKAPSPSGGTEIDLLSVSCAGKKDCIAVGSYLDSSNATNALSEQWNGKSWQLLTLPTPAGSTSSALSAVSCATADSCMAVGTFTGASGTATPLAYDWDGSAWTIESSPAIPKGSSSAEFSGVSCLPSIGCIAVGSYASTSSPSVALAESWDGASWTVRSAAIPNGATQTNFAGVSCLGPSGEVQCTAVGSWINPAGWRVPLAEMTTSALNVTAGSG